MVNSMKKFFFFIAKVAICGVIIISIFIACSDYYIHNTQPGCYQSQYSLTIRNVSYYAADGFITDIIVPIPYLKGENVFSENDLQGRAFGDWKSVLVESEDGRMLALQLVGTNLSDVTATFETGCQRIGEKRWDAKDLALMPVASRSRGINNSPLSIIESEGSHSTTIIFNPKNLLPLTENAPPITVDLEFIVLGDRTGLDHIDNYRIMGHCEIPKNFTGKIPLGLNAYTRKVYPADGNITWVPVISPAGLDDLMSPVIH